MGTPLIQNVSTSGGTMTREALRSLPGAKEGLVRKYIDKEGRKRHAGVPGRLKGSQFLGFKNIPYSVHGILHLQ